MWCIGRCVATYIQKKRASSDSLVIRLGKACGIYILTIKDNCLTFASPTFEPCMTCIVVPCFAFRAMSENVGLQI